MRNLLERPAPFVRAFCFVRFSGTKCAKQPTATSTLHFLLVDLTKHDYALKSLHIEHWLMQSSYRTDIDGLRALAVVAVVINHIEPSLLPAGHLGVDIFFVISGFVIAQSVSNREDARLVPFLLDFYARRARRLVPALALCVASTSLLVPLFDPEPDLTLRTGLTALVGLSNLYLIRQASDYFSESAALNAFTHTWSLGVEEQFYLIFPLLFWAFLGRNATNGRFAGLLLPIMLCLSVLSYAGSVFASWSAPIWGFYLMPTRFWELGLGVLAFFGRTFLATELRLVAQKALILPLGAAIAGLWLLSPGSSPESTLLVTVCIALLAGVGGGSDLVSRGLSVSPLRYIGRISYSLYLFHWPVLCLARWTIGVNPWTIPFLVLLMLAVTHLCYTQVELRFRQPAPAGRSIFWAFGGVALVAALLLVLAVPLKGRLYTGNLPQMAQIGVGSLAEPYKLGQSIWHGEDCVLSSNAEAGTMILTEGCTLGDFEQAIRRVLVVGNSFSAAFVQGFDSLVTEDGYAVVITSSWGASVVPEIENRSAWSLANAHYWKNVVPALGASLQSGDILFLVNDLHEFSPTDPVSQTAEELARLDRGLRRLSAELAKQGVGLAMLGPLPFAREALCEPSTAAPQWFSPMGRSCRYLGREETLARMQPLRTVLADLDLAGVIHLVDVLDSFCEGLICDYLSADGQILYRDIFSHPSVEGVRLASPTVRQALLNASLP